MRTDRRNEANKHLKTQITHILRYADGKIFKMKEKEASRNFGVLHDRKLPR